jgi:hypothetical protein
LHCSESARLKLSFFIFAHYKFGVHRNFLKGGDMKFLMNSLIIIGTLAAVPALACRPDIYSIRSAMALEAITAAFQKKHRQVTELTGVKVLSTDAFWVNTNSGYQCPDKYVIEFELEYEKCFTLRATATTGEEVVFGGVNSCIPDHPSK